MLTLPRPGTATTAATDHLLPAKTDRLSFLLRLCVHLAIAIAAYALVLSYVFPGHIFPIAALAGDMYGPADLAAAVSYLPHEAAPGALVLLTLPRPVSFMAVYIAGQFGFEGSVIFFAALTILNLALALTLLEHFALKIRIPAWIAFATFSLAMAAPAFYANSSYDDGNACAVCFGLLGIYFWESRTRARSALLLAGACFTASLLAKESFVPALVVYVVAAANRDRLPMKTAASLICLPFLAITISLLDIVLSHSPLAYGNASLTNPYRIDVSLLSLIASAKFYTAPLANAPFLALLAACATGMWMNRRLRLGFTVLVAALLLYVPYLPLPNHRIDFYAWTPFPLLMLLLPIGWVRAPVQQERENSGPIERAKWQIALAVAAPVLTLLTIWQFRTQNFRDESWYLTQQRINGSLLKGIRSLEPAVAASREILICGVVAQLYPWQHAFFINSDLHFKGRWTVATQAPQLLPAHWTGLVRPLAYHRIRWEDYDLIVVFASDGDLVGAYRPREIRALARAFGGRRLSNLDLITILGDRRQVFSL